MKSRKTEAGFGRALVIGDGGWGTALALLLDKNGVKTTLWSAFPEHAEEMRRAGENLRFLPGVPLPSTLRITADPMGAGADADLVVTAVPTQHLRGVLGWPLGETGLTAPAVAMVNVVGPADGSDPRERLPRALAETGVHVHLYDKSPAPGRKLGHVTVRSTELATAREAAQRAASILEGEL